MIRPMFPTPDLSAICQANWLTILSFIIILASTITAAVCLARFAAEKYHGKKTCAVLWFIAISVAMATTLYCFFGYAATTIQGIILTLVLLFSSYQDIKTRACDDYLHLIVVVAAFIGAELTAIPNMFLSAMFVISVMVISVHITNSDIGGADIKMAAACAFVLGLKRGVVGLIAGLLLAVTVNLIKNRKKNKTGFPMIPYLATGFMMAYFI